MATTVITEIPLFTDPAYNLSISLEGQSRKLYFYWNTRMGGWHFDCRNEDNTPVFLGESIVADYPLIADYTLEEFNLTGYFLLEANNQHIVRSLSEGPEVMAQFFKLFYVFVRE